MKYAIARYGSQRVGVGFDFAFGWGVRPSVCAIRTTRNVDDLPPVSELRIEFDGGVLVFPRCRLSSIVAPGSTESGGIVDLLIEDRRWKWQFGLIDGDYNRPGESGRLTREKTPQELARLLFAAMGESEADVSSLPNDARPRAAWQAADPAAELVRLCAVLGCVPSLEPTTNQAVIYRVGEGAPLPEGARVSSTPGASVLPIPDEIRIIGGAALFETTLELGEAVGIEVDGTFKPIDELSYKPADWSLEVASQFANVTGTVVDPDTGKTIQKRSLAQASVYRYYRVTGQAGGGWSPRVLRGTDYEPKSRDDLHPLLDFRLQRSPVTQNRLPAIAAGVFVDRRKGLANTDAGTVYPGGFSILGDQSVVQFDEETFRWDGGKILPAQLQLRAAYGVTIDGVPIRYEKFRQRNGETFGAGPRVEVRPEMVREVIEREGGDVDNRPQIDRQADYYLDAINAQYADALTETAVYPGVAPLRLSGALRRVVWSGSVDAPPVTIASLRTEPNPFVTPWEDTPDVRRSQELVRFLSDITRRGA